MGPAGLVSACLERAESARNRRDPRAAPFYLPSLDRLVDHLACLIRFSQFQRLWPNKTETLSGSFRQLYSPIQAFCQPRSVLVVSYIHLPQSAVDP